MGIYVSVRGWLECDEKQLDAVHVIIRANEDNHYSSGWGAPRQHFNWSYWVFYGGNIRESAVSWLQDQLRQMHGSRQ